MDPIRNPYAPGAGTQPPKLAGRGDLRRVSEIAVARFEAPTGYEVVRGAVGPLRKHRPKDAVTATSRRY